ncbi:mitochondrial inner membrane protein COX18-like isoform X2 [Varroa destructor]|uniref:Membrane insertase YidC/Oxa/ALB C-terminal domain-containing protein n=1 Tax=Varroa destructor TaxID=109461 RepID=A0A7M7JXL4_VARDE|nr:mitochondrial inner membrane protein COX18-like isoform X2 [Varroa destructor]
MHDFDTKFFQQELLPFAHSTTELRRSYVHIGFYISDTSEIRSCSSGQKRNLSWYSCYENICHSDIVKFAENSLINVHDSIGLPWWACIAVSTLGLRITTSLPLAVYSQYISAKLANLEPEALELKEKLLYQVKLAERKYGLSNAVAKATFNHTLKVRILELYQRENCHPAKSTITVLTQIPLWITFSLALRNTSIKSLQGVHALESFQHEGLLQISNLALPDPTFIVPICTVFINLFNIQLYSLRSNAPVFGWNRIISNAFRLSAIVFLPIAVVTPSGITLYWLCSALTATAQNLLLMSPRFRRLCKVPQTKKESKQPYVTIIENLRRQLPFIKPMKK